MGKSRLTNHLTYEEQQLVMEYFQHTISPVQTAEYANLLLEKKKDPFRIQWRGLETFIQEEFPSSWSHYLLLKKYREENTPEKIKEAQGKKASEWDKLNEQKKSVEPHAPWLDDEGNLVDDHLKKKHKGILEDLHDPRDDPYGDEEDKERYVSSY